MKNGRVKTKTIAVLMTCHNRKKKTLESLCALSGQKLPIGFHLEIFLVDDASTDGTAEAIQQVYPEVKIIKGKGELFWNGGMGLAFTQALRSDPDYYLWLNDDTKLYPDAIEKLLSTVRGITKTGKLNAVIVGSTCDTENGNPTYGGMVQSAWWHPLKFKLVQPSGKPQLCHTMNGNCVLIPRFVAKRVGNLDSGFTHSTGDIDYGLRVRQQGGSVWLAPGYVGECNTNPPEDDIWSGQNFTFSETLKKIQHPKGLPVKEWKIFARRYAGPLWMFYWGLPYLDCY